MPIAKDFIKRHPLLIYFTLTFIISWGAVLIIAGPNGIPVAADQAVVLGMALLLGPSVAAILLTGLTSGRDGFRKLLSHLLRWRVRTRIGLEAHITDNVKAGIGLASGPNGVGSSRSSNQTLTNAFSTKTFNLDKAYIEWTPDEAIKLTGGKYKNPLYHPGDLLWDSDLRFEGLSVNVDYSRPFAGSDWDAWEQEYLANVQPQQPFAFPSRLVEPALAPPFDEEPTDAWYDTWNAYVEEEAAEEARV